MSSTTAMLAQSTPIPFSYIYSEHIRAFTATSFTPNNPDNTNLVYGTDYTITGQNFITMKTLATGLNLVIYRRTPETQEIDWTDGEAVYTPSIESADDKKTPASRDEQLRKWMYDKRPRFAKHDRTGLQNRIFGRGFAEKENAEAEPFRKLQRRADPEEERVIW